VLPFTAKPLQHDVRPRVSSKPPSGMQVTSCAVVPVDSGFTSDTSEGPAGSTAQDVIVPVNPSTIAIKIEFFIIYISFGGLSNAM
jgi:hypothetical protein